MDNIGEKLRQIRISKNLKLTDVAKSAGISQASLSFIENGKNQPTVETVYKILAAFGITLSDFFSDHTPELLPELHRIMEKVYKLPPDKLKVLESVLDTWVSLNNTDTPSKIYSSNISTNNVAADQTAKYEPGFLSQIIEREYDIDFICHLLNDEVIILTDEDLNPLSFELREDFIRYLRTHNPPELLEQTDISEDDPAAAHRQGHLRTKHEGVTPEFMAIRRITYRLNKILKNYLSNINSKPINNSRLK